MAEPEGPSQSAFEAGLKEASQKAKSQPAAADMLQSSALPEPESEPDRHTNRSDQMQPQSAELKPQVLISTSASHRPEWILMSLSIPPRWSSEPYVILSAFHHLLCLRPLSFFHGRV